MSHRQQPRPLSRRSFMKQAAVAAAVLPAVSTGLYSGGPANGKKAENALEVHIFSKSLHFLDHQRMAEFAAKVGFDGVDLTVRPSGHVEPENVSADLPKAVKAIHQAGLKAKMIATAMADPADAVGRNVLEVAAGLGIRFYRTNYFQYLKDEPVPESIAFFQDRAKKLSELNRKLGIVGCYQNHAGLMMGASLWELWEILRHADHDSLGVQYDVRHAVAEGGLSWVNGLRLIHPHIKTIVLKDFKWVEQQRGQWRPVSTPIGEGMVDFKKYFRMLKDFNIQVPASLHMEYPLGGAESGAKQLTIGQEKVFDAMKSDLLAIRKLWQEA